MKLEISESDLKKIFCSFLLFCIGVGIILHIVPYFYNRSLWVDEAMLASSICTRTFSELVASPLDWEQSSSVGWLFIVKILTVIFGTSEIVLRIWSLITAFGCIIFIYLLMKDKVEKHYALLFTAVFSLTDRYIYYGNEVKPYMSDNLCCLLVLFIWQKYREKEIDFIKIVLIYSIIIWFSFSAVFFVAACMMIECFQIFKTLIKSKERRGIFNLGLCAVVLVSFLLNYVFWLSKTSDNAGGVDYWYLLRFPLIPTSFLDIKLIFKMAYQFLAFYPIYGMLFAFLSLVYIFITIKNRKDTSNLVVPFIVSILLLFVASYCRFYPIQDRLVQAYPIVLIVISAYACNEIESSYMTLKTAQKKSWIVCFYYGVLVLCLGITGINGCKHFFARHVYQSGSEVASNVEYLNENLTDVDVIYVFRFSIPIYEYEFGYETDYKELKMLSESVSKSNESLSVLPYRKDNTIFGQNLIIHSYQVPYSYEYMINEDAIAEDANMIIENDSVYLFTSHKEWGIPELIKKLEEHGTVEIVNESHKTHLYHFVRRR